MENMTHEYKETLIKALQCYISFMGGFSSANATYGRTHESVTLAVEKVRAENILKEVLKQNVVL